MKAERIADRDDQLADPQAPRIAEPGEGPGLAVEPQNGEVGIGVVADAVGGEGAPVGQGRLDLARAAHHVAVGQQISVGGEDDPRAGAAARTADLKMHHRRSDLVDGADHGARIGVEQRRIGGGGRSRRLDLAGLVIARRKQRHCGVPVDKNKVGTFAGPDKMGTPGGYGSAVMSWQAASTR